jgi:hypothetical protein
MESSLVINLPQNNEKDKNSYYSLISDKFPQFNVKKRFFIKKLNILKVISIN